MSHIADMYAEITRRILAVSDPEQIIVFGSHARGTAHDDSDIDLLVIEDVALPRQASIKLLRALRGISTPIDVIVATPQQIQAHRNTIGLIYGPALREGRILYERSTRL